MRDEADNKAAAYQITNKRLFCLKAFMKKVTDYLHTFDIDGWTDGISNLQGLLCAQKYTPCKFC